MKNFLSQLFGRLTWSSPPWVNFLRCKANSRPSLFWGMFSGFIALLIVAGYGFHWYNHLPRPPRITANITVPKITPLAHELVPDSLAMNFGLEKNKNFTPESVAPLNLIGKEVKEGITLTPSAKGKWVFENDSRLVFTPTEDWPAGQSYDIHFDKTVFASKLKMATMDYEFSTEPFQASIAEFKFYQDPVDPKLRQVVATVNFNYPVDTNNFEKKTSLTLLAAKSTHAQSYQFTVTYDEHKRTAYLHSEPLPLPETERYLQLTIGKGVKAITGPSITTETLTQNVLIPDAASFLKVSQASANIVRNEQDRPEQILTLETTSGVTETELNKSLHVYLLPADYPATATEEIKKDYVWQNPGEVTPDILKLATPVVLQNIPADRDYATLHSYKFTSPTPRFMYVRVDKGVRSAGDYVLANDFSSLIKVPEYPKEIGFLHKGALLALSGEKKLSVTVRGVPAVRFSIARVLPNDVNQLVTQTEGQFSHPRFINYSFNRENISEIFSEIQPFDASDLAKEQYTALDVGRYLSANINTGGPQGLFLLQADGWDPIKKTTLDVKADRLVLITDLGLLVKDNNDGSHDVFVQSITQGTPVPSVNITILGKNGLPVLTRATDAGGHVSFPSLKDFIDERAPTVWLAKSSNDVAFIPYNNADRQLNFSRFDVGGVYSNNQELQTLSAYLFSDRGIYRPGDTIHVGMIVKQASAGAQPAGLPVEATVTDARGTTIKDQKFTLDTTGYLTLDVPTALSSPSGQYSINLFIIKDNHPENLLGSTSVRVAEFQPDRMHITTTLSETPTKGWISPVGLTARVGLWNLYGAAAADRKISAKIILTPQRVAFDEYPGYFFVDPLIDPKKPSKVFTDTLSDARTNDQGQADFNLNLERFEKATYQLTFFAEGFESDGGRSVTTQTMALVSPLAYLVGYKPDGDLNYIKQNTQRRIHFIAINPQLKQQSVANLKIQLLSLHPVTTLVKNPDGTFQYQSLIQISVVNTKPFVLDQQGIDYVLPAQQTGDFAVVILDQNNTELCRAKFSIVGASQLPLAKNAELTVKLNKSEYLADSDIELQITAPYTGAGLITIERDRTYAYQWFKTNTTNSIQKIHIPKDFQGNGYVNIAFVRDWNSPEIFVSPLSYATVPFTVNHDNHVIHLELNTPALARPGELFPIQYKSDKPGKIIIFAVDEGILQVTDFPTPDPLQFFFQKHALEVITQQTVDQILPKFLADRELSAVGGDSGEAMMRKNLNPFKRKTDLPVVYWSGIVDTDNTWRKLNWQVPDYFNGTVRVMAVAVAADALGTISKKSEVRGDFVINPNVPTFVAPNDEFEITASIANNVKNSGDNASVLVQLHSTPQLEIIGKSDQTIVIPEGHEQTVHFKLRAKSLLGSAQMTFTANTGDHFSKMAATLSVRPASAYVTTMKTGSADKSKSISLDRELYPEYRQVDAAMSVSPLVLVVGLQRYLDNFPYGCTEQLVSKVLPLLAMAKQSWFVSNSKMIADKIQTTIQLLAARQMSNGGFSYWPDVSENDSNAFASVYAMHFLTEAREQGFDVPTELLRTGTSYLKELAAQNVTSLDQARIQAYAIYVLTRNEIVTTDYLTRLQLYLDKDTAHAWQHDITSAYMAATYELLKSHADAVRLIDYYEPGQKTEASDFYNQYIADAEYLYLIAKHFPDRLAKLDKKLVMALVTAMNSDAINTVLSGETSLALGAYAPSFVVPNGAAFSVSMVGDNGKQQTLPAVDSLYQKVSVGYPAKKVLFNASSGQSYFYQLTEAGFDKDLPTKVLKQGLEVYREYRNLQGNAVTATGLGSEIEVHVQVRALTDDYLNNVAIVDLLPGGFEVVPDSLHAENMDYTDIREDRVVFFGSIGPDARELIYRIRAVNTGSYIVPPIFAGSMYNPQVFARGIAGKMTVT